MPFEIFIVPGVVCLIIGFIRGLKMYRKQAQ